MRTNGLISDEEFEIGERLVDGSSPDLVLPDSINELEGVIGR